MQEYKRPINLTKKNRGRSNDDPLWDVKILQLIWAIFLSLTVGTPALLALLALRLDGVVAALLLLTYTVACFRCFKMSRLAWGVAILFTCCVLLLVLVSDFFMMLAIFSNVENNPEGKLMLVIVNSALLLAPSATICYSYFINLEHLKGVFEPKHSVIPDAEHDGSINSNP